MTISAAPCRAACLMRAPTIGWFSVGFAPQTRIVAAASMSSNEFVAAPVPKIAPSAAALGE